MDTFLMASLPTQERYISAFMQAAFANFCYKFHINFKIISKDGNYKTNIGIKKNKIFCQYGQVI